MLSRPVISLLTSLPHRADAQEVIGIQPYYGILWDDETPRGDVGRGLTDEDRRTFYRLFSIRVSIWREQTLTSGDQQLWEAARAAAPNHGLFHRLERSQAQLDDDDQAMRDVLS